MHSLTMCFWNIGGFKSKGMDKTKDPLFLKAIESYDLVFLAETHVGYNSGIQKIGEFLYHPVCRPVEKANNRFYGGLAILRKPFLKDHVKILKNNNPDYQWIRLEKSHFGFPKDLYICVVYFPPTESSYTKKLDVDIFESIEKDMALYGKNGDFLICGDINARTGVSPDYILQDNSDFLPLSNCYKTDKQILKRYNRDTKLDQRGKELLDFCIGHQLRILNGRNLGDSFGNYTCFTPNGCSTVDYAIVSENVLDGIFFFRVKEFLPTLSDCHCQIEWRLLSSCMKTDKLSVNDKTKLKPMPPRYIWSDDSADSFQKALTTDTVKSKISGFLNTPFMGDTNSINLASEKLVNIFVEAADKSLKKPKQKIKGKPKNPKWFDCNLQQMRFNLMSYGKVYTRFPRDPVVKNHFYKLYREYNKARKAKRKSFKQNLLNELETLHEDNPKKYWQLINELQGKHHDDNKNSVSSSDWLSHFNNLNEVKKKFHKRLNEIEEKVKQLEKNPCFNELDFMITESEIAEAIAHIKLNKSPGLDGVSNNMIRHCQFAMLPCFAKIFNACLSNGIYPEKWAEGYIMPLHKGSDINDPSNYRGLTITSAIGKLFNRILNERLVKFLEKHHIIDNCQIGFTKKARTSDHMFILRTLIDKYCTTKKKHIFACFVDLKKAFDTVIHAGIKLRLMEIGCGSLFYNIIKNMYAVSKSSIKIDNNLTDFIPTNLGVKQGDNLSPNLFKIFINEFPNYLEKSLDPVYLDKKAIHCLMYADDIILLSTSAAGLQEKLNLLDKFCQDWCLSVNTQKTKILIFNKSGKLVNTMFKLDNTVLECVNKYKYLGVTFCASGSFTHAQEELYKKATKAYFKLSKDFLSLNPNVHTSMHVFDHTIKPILLYGCEIWGTFNPFSAKFRNGFEDLCFDQIYSNQKAEILHQKFCKFILGVHKKSVNYAVLSELGRFPLYFNIVKAMLKYHERLNKIADTFPLLHAAYNESVIIDASKHQSWYSSVKIVIKKISASLNLNDNKITKKVLIEYFTKEWKKNLIKVSEGKLCTYVKFKTNFGFEKYLSVIKNFQQRQQLTRFRISSHKLSIETGRYKGIPRHDRICTRCNENSVEDEVHFLCICQGMGIKRNSLNLIAQNKCKNYIALCNESKLIWLLTNEDYDILNALCTFLTYI